MRWTLLSIGAALVACTSGGAPERVENPAIEFAIPNPQRPGSKARDCETLTETTDGCTFHTEKDDVNRARLPLAADPTWTANTNDGDVATFRNADNETAANGAQYQVLELVPSTAQDADIAVTFDKLAGEPGALKVIERLRVNVMIHAIGPAS